MEYLHAVHTCCAITYLGHAHSICVWFPSIMKRSSLLLYTNVAGSNPLTFAKPTSTIFPAPSISFVRAVQLFRIRFDHPCTVQYSALRVNIHAIIQYKYMYKHIHLWGLKMRYMHCQRTSTLSALTHVYLHRSELYRRLSVSSSLVRKS
jgi:hypothetical protein